MTEESSVSAEAIFEKIVVLPRVSTPSPFGQTLSQLLKETLSDDYIFFPGISHIYHKYDLGASAYDSAPRRFVTSVVFIDLGLEPSKVLSEIARGRSYLIDPVFVLCSNAEDEFTFASGLSPEDAERFAHYYRLDKDNVSPEVLDAILLDASHTAIAKRDRYQAVTLTLFVSYSRKNWKFAYGLTQDLKSHGYHVWLDKSELAGGDDWMNEIEQSLSSSDVLLLVASPDSLASQFVKMEYRTFLEQGKPIIPILIEPVAKMPFELTGLQYIDLTEITDSRQKMELVLQAIRKRSQSTQHDD